MDRLKVVGLILLGLGIAAATVAGFEVLAHQQLAGSGLYLAVALGYGLAALLSCLAMAWLGGHRTCVAVVVVLAVLAVINLFSAPHPDWFVPVAGLALTGGGWLGYRLSKTRRGETR